jgi:hypothetical protein
MSTVEEIAAMADKPRPVTLAESDALRALPANRLDPQALISKAIEQGAGIETLERLVQLAKDIRAITAKEAYNEAIAEFQRRCPPIKKNKDMVVPGRPIYRYGDLGEILSTIAPLMGELGLSHAWRAAPATKPMSVAQICIISHRLGHEKESGPCEIPYREDNRMNPGQSVGSAMTYAQRYSLCAVLGIKPEDDDDANNTDLRARGGQAKATERREGQDKPVSPARESEPAASVVVSHIDSENDVEESKTLFPTPDADRDHLIVEINSIINRVIKQKRVKPDDVRQWKKTYLGQEDADILKADPAALVDFSKYLLGRFGA